jgi:hypothetical protein
MTPFTTDAVATAFAAYPAEAREKLFALRALVFATAAATPGVGEIEETLKWGEPAYLTPRSKSGSTIRMAWKASAPTRYALYFNCQTDLVESFRATFASVLRFEGNRAIVMELSEAPPMDVLALCIKAALTYHRRHRA